MHQRLKMWDQSNIYYQMLLGRSVMRPSIVGLILKIEQNVRFPVPKTIGRALGNTMPFSLVPKPLGGPSIVLI